MKNIEMMRLPADLQRGANKQVPLVMYPSADDSDVPSAG